MSPDDPLTPAGQGGFGEFKGFSVRHYLFFIALSAYSGLTLGGCGEEEKICFRFENEKLVDQSPCSVVECANVTGGLQEWTWKNGEIVNISANEYSTSVNGKPGYYFEQGDMTCYGIGKESSRKEYFCHAEIKPDSTQEKNGSKYDACLKILGAGIYNGLLEDLCGFNGGVKAKLKVFYSEGECPDIISEDEINRLAKEILEDTKMRYKTLGEDDFCSNNKQGYYDLAGE